MAVLKKHLTPLSKKGSITKHAGKGSRAQLLGSGQQSSITGGNSFNRSMNDYAKQTPMADPMSSGTDSDGDYDFGG